MTAAVGIYLMLTASVGTVHAGHVRAEAECSACVDDSAEVSATIQKLRSAPCWIGRRQAARALRAYDELRYPEAVEALIEAVRRDRQALVRQEAAASLGKAKTCHPGAREVLGYAAANDPSLLARLAARKALRSLADACEAPCDVCGGAPVFEEPELLPTRFDLPGEPPMAGPGPALEALPSAPSPTPIPSAPGSGSPFLSAPAGSETSHDHPQAGPPSARFDDVPSLSPPEAPIDRYNPRPSDPAPTPLPRITPPPRPSWP